MKIIRPVLITNTVLVSTDVPENDHPTYNAATTYALGDRVITAHRVYESLQASNTGHAVTDAAWWLDTGATNRWRMFDGGESVQTEQDDEIQVVLSPGRIDSVALLNIDAADYRVELKVGATVVYDTGIVSLGLDNTVTNWYEYFFEPTAERKRDVALTNIPQFINGTLTITLTSPTATVRIGELIVGNFRQLGKTQWGPRVGIDDYSVKSRDAFGNLSVRERAFSKRVSADVHMHNDAVDETVRMLAAYRATALLWIATEEFSSLIVYGFFRSFDVVIASETGSLCNLEIEGMT